MTPVKLKEHRQCEVRVPDQAVEELRALGAVKRSSRLGADHWQITANEKVGCVQVAGTEVWIEPKLPVGRLLYLAGYGKYVTKSYRWRDDEVQLGEAEGLVSAMAILLAKLIGRAFQQGVLHGYQEREESLPLLRGRLRAGAQARRHPGVAFPLEVRYEELSVDTAENRRLLAAIRKVLDLPGVMPQARALLLRLRDRLAAVRLPFRGQHPPRPELTRLNERYLPALRLADLILDGNSVDQLPKEQARNEALATGFLFDMNQVFQNYLAGMLDAKLRGTVKAQESVAHPWSPDGESTFIPDIVWRRPDGTCAAVIDAKYKGDTDARTGQRTPKGSPLGVESSDIYQVFTYCKVMRTRRGHLVHADVRTPKIRQTTIDDVDLAIHSIDLSLPLDELKQQEANLASEIAP